MELWIRSQDRETLMLANHLDIYCLGDETSKYYIEECGVDMGCYKNKERALEVLNEIHQRLIDLQTLEYLQGTMNLDWKHNRNIDCVYEIPKD